MRPLHCEGCGEQAVVYACPTLDSPGAPTLYLCGVCADLGGRFVQDVKDGEARMTALLLLKIHQKLAQLHALRWTDGGGE